MVDQNVVASLISQRNEYTENRFLRGFHKIILLYDCYELILTVKSPRLF